MTQVSLRPSFPQRSPQSESLFLGREQELENLRASLHEVRAGQGRVALLVGEPGIGKTRLVEEFAPHARQHGALVLIGRCSESAGAPPLWPWVQIVRTYLEIVTYRLSTLSDPCYRVLMAGAVIGREFPLPILEMLGQEFDPPLETEPLLRLLDEALAAHIITAQSQPIGTYSFRHALMREALYSALGTEDRSRLHHQVGEALERLHRTHLTPHLATLAHHFLEASRDGTERRKALTYCQRAGQQALSVLAYDEAGQHYEQALQLLRMGGGDEEQHYALLLARGEAQRLAADSTAARDLGMPGLEAKILPLLRAHHRAESGLSPSHGDRAERGPEAEGSLAHPSAPPGERGLLRHEGEYWTLSYGEQTFRLKDQMGIRHLARLLRAPHHAFHCLELVSTQPGIQMERLTDAGALLDPTAKNAYRQRLSGLQVQLTEAENANDIGRMATLQHELEFLTSELTRAFGLAARERKAGSPVERARVNVTRALKSTIKKIHSHHPVLGHHLRLSVTTGTVCSYTPDLRAPIEWEA